MRRIWQLIDASPLFWLLVLAACAAVVIAGGLGGDWVPAALLGVAMLGVGATALLRDR
jgi:hypothetical protein